MFVGLCTEDGEIKCGIVIAGDPNQLDAVVKSNYAKKLNYSTSYMEFLMEQGCYQNMNSKCIVQLTENYRNHPAILKPVSELFYKETLQCKASTGKYYSLINEFKIFYYFICVFAILIRCHAFVQRNFYFTE